MSELLKFVADCLMLRRVSKVQFAFRIAPYDQAADSQGG